MNEKFRKKRVGMWLRWLALLLFLESSLFAQSIYYFQDFSSNSPPGWTNDGRIAGFTGTTWDNAWADASNFGVAYGRIGHRKDPTNNPQTLRVLSNDGGRLAFRSTQAGVTITSDIETLYGSGVVMQTTQNLGLSIGRMALYNAAAFTATPQRPVGWQIVRIRARLDPQRDDTNPESHRHANRMSFYVFDSTNQSSVFGTQDATFANIISMYETYRAQRPSQANPRSTWGYFTAAENEFNLASALRPDGQSINLDVGGIWWRYDDTCDDYTGANTYGCAGAGHANNVNNHPLGLRIATDGNQFYFYINPDPDGNNQPVANANEYVLVGTAPATFSNNLKAMIGVESERYDTEMQWAEFDNFLIRSVTDGNPTNTKAEIYPFAGNVSDTVNFNIIINPTISATDAGIAEIRVRKPSSFPAWDASSVQVYTDYGTGAAHPEISSINLMSTHTVQANCNYTLPNMGEVRLCVNGNDLFIRFRAHSNASNEVIKNSTPDKRIAIRFNQTLPGSPNLAGAEYQVFVGNEKYNTSHTDNDITGNTGLPYATTGWQKVSAGDAITSQGDNTLAVKVRGIPEGFSSVVPNVVYVGSPQNLQNFIATPNNPDNTGINKLEIEIWRQNYGINSNPNCDSLLELSPTNPDCFTDHSITNLNSDWGIATSNFATSDLFPSNITSSLISGNTKAEILITGGNEIPGQGGLDKITFASTATPVVTSVTYYKVKVKLYNTNVISTTGNDTTTGPFGAVSQIISLRPAKPIAIAKIEPDALSACSSNVAAYAGNTAPSAPNLRLCNTIKTNTVIFTLTNNGLVGNDIKRVRISLPDAITALGTVSVNVGQGTNSFSFDNTSHPTKFTFNNVAGSKYLQVELENVGSGAAAAGLLGNTSPKYSAIITMTITDNLTPLTGTLTHSFTGYVDNGNGDALTDNSYSQDASGSWTLNWVRPYARAKLEVYRALSFSYPIGNPAGNRQLWNTSTNDTVRLAVQVYNPSTIDDATNVNNNIYALQVTAPTGFTGIANVTSSKGGTVSVTGNNIRVDYSTPIPPGDNDIISFDITENCYEEANTWGTNASATTNCPETSHLTFTTRVSNEANPVDFSTTVTSGYQTGPGYNATPLSVGSNVILFVNQPLNAVAYVEVCHNTPIGTRCSTSETADNENNPLLADISLTEDLSKFNIVRYYFRNMGLAGAHIKKVRLYIRGNNDTGWTIGGADALTASWLSSSAAFTNVQCYKNGSTTGTIAYNDANYSNYYIECDYTNAGYGVDVGDVAYIQFEMRHTTNMPANQFISLRGRATNDRFPSTYKPDDTAQSHILAATTTQMPHPTYPEGSTQSIKFQISKPQASIRGFLTLTNQNLSAPYNGINVLRKRNTVQNVTAYYYFENTGVGTNRIYKVKIAIPTPWQGKVSVASNTLDLNKSVSIVANEIVVDYDPANNGTAYLAPGQSDRVQLTLAHDINTEGSSTWLLSATNDYPPDTIVYDAAQIYPQRSNALYVVNPARVRITSSQDVNSLNPGNPTQFYTTNTTPTLVLRVQNDNTSGGRAIQRLRIVYPTPAAGEFVINSVNSSIAGIITPPTTPNPIVIDYSPALAAGALDDITINFKRNGPGDPFDPGTHAWQVQVFYDDGTTDALVDVATNFTGTGGDRLDVSDNLFSGASLDTGFVLPPLPAKAYISVNTAVFNNRGNHLGLAFPGWGNLDGDNNPVGDTLNTTLDDNGLTFVIKNETTLSGNHIRHVKITAPTIVQEISKTAAEINIVRQPGNVTLTQTSDANCTSFAQNYCIKTSGVAANELVLVFNPSVVQGGQEIFIRTSIVKNPSVTTPQSGAFTVQVSNDPNGSNPQTATTPIAEGGTNYDRSLTLHYYNPTELVEYYVEKLDSTAGEAGNPVMLYKTESNHKVVLFLRNSGHAASQIKSFAITLPPNVFSLSTSPQSKIKIRNSSNNYLNAGTDYTCLANCDNSTNDLTGNPEIALTNPLYANDFIKIEFENFNTATVANSGSNPYPLNNSTAVANDRFGVSALTNTSYTQNITGQTLSGKQNFMQLKRPQPVATAYLYEGDVQLETTAGVPLVNLSRDDSNGEHINNTTSPYDESVVFPASAQHKRLIRLIIENQGSGNNHILVAKIKAPSIFTGLSASEARHNLDTYPIQITNTVTASGISLSGSDFEVTYNSGDFNTTTNTRSIISIPVDYNLLNLPSTLQNWQIIVKNDASAADCFSTTVDGCSLVTIPVGKTLTHSFVYPAGGLELFVSQGKTHWSINNQSNSMVLNGEIKISIRPRGNPLSIVALKLPENLVGSFPTLGTITQSHCGGNAGITYPFSGIVAIDYTVAGCSPLPVDTIDEITIPISGTLPANSIASHTFTGRFIYNPLMSQAPFNTTCNNPGLVAADLSSNGTNCLSPIVPQGQTNVYQIVRPPFANIYGTIAPTKNVFDNPLTITVSVADEQGNILLDYQGNPLIAQSDSTGLFRFGGGFTLLKSGAVNDGPGIPMCATVDGMGCLENKTVYLRFAAPGYETLIKPVTLSRGLEIDLGAMGELAQEAFKPQAGADHKAVGRNGSNKCAEVEVPNDGVAETFSVQIECINMAALLAKTEPFDQGKKEKAYEAVLSGKEKLHIPANPSNLPVYVMNLRNGQGQLLENVDLFYRDKRQAINKVQVEGKLRFYYDASLLTSLGYSEENLAVFSYDPYRNYWVKLGGMVDMANKTITVGVGTLVRYYTIAASDKGSGMITDVVVTPRLFTPGYGRHFNRMTLQFQLREPVEKYEVAIFDLSGKLIIKFERPGLLGSGQVFWDGHDERGNLVAGGIYVYVIRAKNEKYRGTIVVTR